MLCRLDIWRISTTPPSIALALLLLAGCGSTVKNGLGAEMEDSIASPYSQWRNGPPTDPSFFPIGVWLQDPRNAERYQHAKERAFVDDVTEAYNARYFLSVLDQEIRRADRYGTSFSMLFLDLDRFKQINDSYGHLVGSEILHRVSILDVFNKTILYPGNSPLSTLFLDIWTFLEN